MVELSFITEILDFFFFGSDICREIAKNIDLMVFVEALYKAFLTAPDLTVKANNGSVHVMFRAVVLSLAVGIGHGVKIFGIILQVGRIELLLADWTFDVVVSKDGF